MMGGKKMPDKAMDKKHQEHMGGGGKKGGKK